MRARYLSLGIFLGTLACAPADDASETSRRELRGDTLVIRHSGVGSWGEGADLERRSAFGEAEGTDTVALGQIIALASGPDGRVFATDRQRLAVRVLSQDLAPLALWGRDGSGPGELRNPDGGLAVFSDGRVAVRDPGNARMQVFTPSGASGGEWRVIDAGLRTRDNFGVQGDTLLSRVVVKSEGPIDAWEYGLARIAPNGRVLDTVAVPVARLPRLTLIARGGNNTAELPLPFAARSLSAWHPNGGFAIAEGDRYAIEWPRADGVLRVEREVEPVAVSPAEAAQERAYVTKGLQWLDPAWTWTGPDIPQSKPLLSQLFTGHDGSLWALREGEAVDGEDPDYQPNEASSVERRLRSRLRFDVFTATGEFLGTLALPIGVQLRPQPVFSASGFVALEIDAVGVPRIVRYTVKTPAPR